MLYKKIQKSRNIINFPGPQPGPSPGGYTRLIPGRKKKFFFPKNSPPYSTSRKRDRIQIRHELAEIQPRKNAIFGENREIGNIF